MKKAVTALLVPAAVFGLKLGTYLFDKHEPPQNISYTYSVYEDDHETLAAYLDREEMRLYEIQSQLEEGFVNDLARGLEELNGYGLINPDDFNPFTMKGSLLEGILPEEMRPRYDFLGAMSESLDAIGSSRREDVHQFRAEPMPEDGAGLDELIDTVRAYDRIYLKWQEYINEFPNLAEERRADRNSISHIVGSRVPSN